MTELTVFKDERKRAFLNAEGADKPLKSPVPDSILDCARAYRLQRFRDEMARQDVAGLLLYDPVNIRYAFDCSNMSIWTAHNPIRCAPAGVIVRRGRSAQQNKTTLHLFFLHIRLNHSLLDQSLIGYAQRICLFFYPIQDIFRKTDRDRARSGLEIGKDGIWR